MSVPFRNLTSEDMLSLDSAAVDELVKKFFFPHTSTPPTSTTTATSPVTPATRQPPSSATEMSEYPRLYLAAEPQRSETNTSPSPANIPVLFDLLDEDVVEIEMIDCVPPDRESSSHVISAVTRPLPLPTSLNQCPVISRSNCVESVKTTVYTSDCPTSFVSSGNTYHQNSLSPSHTMRPGNDLPQGFCDVVYPIFCTNDRERPFAPVQSTFPGPVRHPRSQNSAVTTGHHPYPRPRPLGQVQGHPRQPQPHHWENHPPTCNDIYNPHERRSAATSLEFHRRLPSQRPSLWSHQHQPQEGSHQQWRQQQPLTTCDETAVRVKTDSQGLDSRAKSPSASSTSSEDSAEGLHSVRLYRFLLDELEKPESEEGRLLAWVDKPRGLFRIVRKAEIADKWGKAKNNESMTYEKFSRSLRYYYKIKQLERVHGQYLIYKFHMQAHPQVWDTIRGTTSSLQSSSAVTSSSTTSSPKWTSSLL
ncbi:uncharacterized protein [Littorina saxatilis]|uniref:ETS domain-containing protein n=1 Tax=Littorina saxatilis TaxID=31220 RepID=A0AAN9G8R3_9CAEN